MKFRSLFCGLMIGLSVNFFDAQAQDEIASKISFITGKVTNITFEKELSNLDANDNLTIANLYRVTLDDIYVIEGEFDGDTIALTLKATHKSSIGRTGEIYAVIQNNESNTFKVLYWGVPNKIACIPKEKLKELNITDKFNKMHEIKRSFCEIY